MKPVKFMADRFLHVTLLTLALLAAVGCRSIGPGTITRDRFNYSGALAESWKSQMLLNLVKTRYLDAAVYLEVGQVVSGYSLETTASVSGQIAPLDRAGDTFVGVGASGTFTDRPTITYTPLTGEKFLRSFLAPIHPAKVFSLVQSGYAADFILEWSVDSLNGLRNRPISLNSKREPDPEFFRVLALLREIQDAGAVGLRVEHATNSEPAVVVFFRDERIEPEVQAKLTELRKLLEIPAGPSAFRLVQSPLRGGPGELGITTRSLSQMLAALSFGVEVPPSHVQRKLTPPITTASSAEPSSLMRVQSGSQKPGDSFVAIQYEGAWFWVANDDWKSKRTFSSLLFLFTLADTGGADRLPTITIPAQ